MSRFKMLAFVALITLAFGVALVGDALAEKVKGRNIYHAVKWEQVNVGDKDGHVVAVHEVKGITTNLEGKWFCNGYAYHETSLCDVNLKTGDGSGQGYLDQTDRDGDKFYCTWEGKHMQGGKFATGYWTATWNVVKGTGKFEGIHGGGTSTEMYYPAEMLFYANAEWDVELPRR